MTKLILKCNLAPGDIVMLTAAVRDLHYWYPDRYVTDVRTSAPALWENNPHLTRLSETEPDVELIECSYPLINYANQAPYHCLHGFMEFLNQRLGLAIRPTAFKGDIHLSAQEKAWYSQVRELAGKDIPFWVIAAGGKYDVTIKWWDPARYQAVIDFFRGKIQFVQVGDVGHHHPRLGGVIDLRGKTTLRELVRLVYHAQGVLCPVTLLMHLAAAVETSAGQPSRRACVVVAGAREPAHWEAYPDHQFMHSNGALACCRDGGCWRDRVQPLRDGDERDKADHLCVQVSAGLPRCMDLITPASVIERIETYFQGGALRFLSPQAKKAAARAVRATARNAFDQQPLTLHSAGVACDDFVRELPVENPENYAGRGLVMVGGGVRYFTCAWVCIQMLRRLGCQLPVELWHFGRREVDPERRSLLADLGVDCVDTDDVRKRFPARLSGGWQLKPYAILHSRFREVLFLDADNVPVANPEFLFETTQFRRTGALFWPDFDSRPQAEVRAIWRSCGLRQPREPEFESGQMLLDKDRCWRALRLALWFNENSDFYYQHIYGDKETFHLAFRKLKQPYALIPHPVQRLAGTLCQHDFDGRRIFQHRNRDKWDLLLHNRRVPDFHFEKECREYLLQLRQRWDGGLAALLAAGRPRRFARVPSRTARPELVASIMSCSANGERPVRRTCENLARTDWTGRVIEVHADGDVKETAWVSQQRCALLALQRSLDHRADYVLLLEEDLEFNRYLRHNLERWAPLQERRVTVAGIYNPRLREVACDIANNARLMEPRAGLAAGALLISRPMVEYLVRHWHHVRGAHGLRMARLAGRLQQPFYCHAPSLAQRLPDLKPIEAVSAAPAIDFNPSWKA